MTADSGVPNPFKGLRPYLPTDADVLFGRDADFTLMRERLRAGRTTLLFAASGVGKTSFLRARFLPHITDEFKVCYHRAWADQPPLAAVCQALQEQVPEYRPGPTLARSLAAFERRTPESVDLRKPLPLHPPAPPPNDLVLVLDQFEEIFQYWSYRSEFTAFLHQICDVITRQSLGVRVVLSMRDDFLGRLSVFDNRIPDLFNNYYRLTSPTKKQAMEIIQRTASGAGAAVDSAGLHALVDDLATLRRVAPSSKLVEFRSHQIQKASRLDVISRAFRPFVRLFRMVFPRREPKPDVSDIRRDFVVPPYLQIVCQALWDRREEPFLAGYTTAGADSAAKILEGFCTQRLRDLGSERRRDLAARAFDFLMTREGAKMAYQLDRLAEHMGVKKAELFPVLEQLSDEQRPVLRRFKGNDGSWWFELYHDMYALILYEWKRGHQQRRAVVRQWRLGLVGLAGVLVVVGIIDTWRQWTTVQDASQDYPESSYLTLKSRLTMGGLLPFLGGPAERAWARYWDRRAASAEQDEARDRALMLRLKAADVWNTPARGAAVERLAAQDYGALDRTLFVDGEPSTIALSDDGRRLLVVTSAGSGEVWNVGGDTRSTGTFSMSTIGPRRGQSSIVTAAFLSGSEFVAIDDAGTLQHWIGPPSREAWQRERCRSGIGAFVTVRPGVVVVAERGVLRRLADLPLDSACERVATGTAAAMPTGQAVAVSLRRPAVVSGNRAPGRPAIEQMFADGSRLLTRTEDNRVCEWAADTLEQRRCPLTDATGIAVDTATHRIGVLRGNFFRNDRGTFQLYSPDWRPIGPQHPVVSPFEPEISFVPGGAVHVGGWTRYDVDGTTGQLLGHGLLTSSKASFPPSADGEIHMSLDQVWMTARDGRLRTPVLWGDRGAAISADGTVIATGSADGSVKIWRTEQFAAAGPGYLSVNGERAPAAFASAASCHVGLEEGGQIIWRDATANVRRLETTGLRASPSLIAVSPDCRRVAATTPAGALSLWDVSSSALVTVVPPAERGADAVDLVFNADSTRLLVAMRTAPLESDDSRAGFVLVDSASGKVVARSFAADAGASRGFNAGLAGFVRFSGDSRTVLFSPGGGLQLYNSGDGVRVPWDDSPDGAPLAVFRDWTAMTLNAGSVAIHLTNPPEVVPLSGARPASRMAFNADGTYVAAIEGRSLSVYSLQSRARLSNDFDREVLDVRFHPSRPNLAVCRTRDGIQLISMADGTVRRVGDDVALGRPLAEQFEDEEPVVVMLFSDSGDQLIVATHRWLHRLSVTDRGATPLSSRLLPGAITGASSVRVIDSAATRVAVALEFGTAATLVDVVDFDATPPAAAANSGRPDVPGWQRKLGLRLEGRAVVAGVSR